MTILADLLRQILLIIRGWFFKFIPRQEYLYMACGGLNLVFDTFLFYMAYHYLFRSRNVVTPVYTFSPHIAAFLVSFTLSFPTGFFMSRYIVWVNSPVQAHHQLFRYLMGVFICIVLNIGFIKFFVEVIHFYPLPSKLMATVFVIAFSYVYQRYYTFKIHKATEKI
jgi:hypothetical protein